VGVLAALLSARESGVGQDVDAAMVDGAALLMAMAYGNYGNGSWKPERGRDPFSGERPYYRTYACADGRYIALGSSEPKLFAALVRTLGLSERIEITRQRDPVTWPDQISLFSATFMTRSRDEWVELFAGVDASVTPVLSPTEAPEDPHLRARETFLTDSDGLVAPAPAPRFSATPASRPAPVSLPGQDTDSILSELGLSADEVRALRDAHVVA
jgi:alpha-methylacyl-CoA racemase